MSHPTVIHHFGSREALVKAVVTRAFATLKADVVRAILQTDVSAPRHNVEVAALIDRIATVLVDKGHGRALGFLALSGQLSSSEDLGLRAAAEVSHAIRSRVRGATTPPVEDTLFTMLLVFYALFGQSIVGDLVASGPGFDDGSHARFLTWFGRLIEAQLQTGPF